MLLAASTQRTIGFVILAIVFVGYVVYLILNARASRDEVGSEIELAANRKPYLEDEELEGTKLDKSLWPGWPCWPSSGWGCPSTGWASLGATRA